MLCSGCGSDLAEGVSVCAKCGIDEQELVTVCRTSDSALLPILKSLLDAVNIPYLVQGEEALGLFPLGPISVGIIGGRPTAASILVPRERAEEAERLLEAPPAADS
jgi:hypothetical protein